MKNQHIPYSSAINDMIFDIKKKGVVSFPKKGLAENATDFFNQISSGSFSIKQPFRLYTRHYLSM